MPDVCLQNGHMLNINKQEIEKPRNASKIAPWVDAKLRELATTAEGKHAVRFREGLAKPLVEEALPLGIFCEKYFNGSRCVVIHHVLGNQNFDAKVRDKRIRKSQIEYLEITQAHEGENAHLRMVHLEQKGHANILGAVFKSGTKKTGIKVEIEEEAIEHDIVVDREIRRIHEAAVRKSHKQYPVNTGLVIVCDDYVAFSDENDIEKLRNFAIDNLLKDLSNFRMVFIVGWSSNLFLEFKPNAS